MPHVSKADPNVNIKRPQETQGRRRRKQNGRVWLSLPVILCDWLVTIFREKMGPLQMCGHCHS